MQEEWGPGAPSWAMVTFGLRVLRRTGNESALHHGGKEGETMFSRFLWLSRLMCALLALLTVDLMTSGLLALKRGNLSRVCCAQNGQSFLTVLGWKQWWVSHPPYAHHSEFPLFIYIPLSLLMISLQLMYFGHPFAFHVSFLQKHAFSVEHSLVCSDS